MRISKRLFTKRHPLISVIVPCYNVADTLCQALDSILAQTYKNLEVICINDGSTDDTLTIAQKIAATDKRVRVITKTNGGYGASCNRGLDEAHGAWIAIVEPDDWIEPKMYARMISFAKSLKNEIALQEIDVIKTPYWRIVDPDTPQQLKLNCSYRGRIPIKKHAFVVEEAPHLLDHHPSIWSALYRVDFLRDNEIRFHEIPGAGWADTPFLYQTLCSAEAIVYLDEPYYCYREETDKHFKNFTLNNPFLPLDRWQDCTDELEKLNITPQNCPEIWGAHQRRGFNYLSSILESLPLTYEGLEDAARAMFERMNPSLVFADTHITPGCKKLYARLMSISLPLFAGRGFRKALILDGLYNLKNIGPRNTLKRTQIYFKNKQARAGASKALEEGVKEEQNKA